MKADEVKNQVMRHYSELGSALSIGQKYPELDMNDEKKHVLFVQCLLERDSFYRTYLPYLILNDTETHSSIIASIQKQDFTKGFEDYDVFLQLDLIKWADFIVFPVLFFDCKKMFSSILEVNPDIKFVMDLDQIYFGEGEIINPTVLENIRFNHLVTCSSSQIATKYKAAFEDKYNNSNKSFITLPTFLVSSYLKKKSDDPIEQTNSIRVGLQEGNYSKALIETLVSACKASKSNCVICIYGNNKNAKSFPESLAVEKYKAVKFLDYYSSIDSMNIDFMIVEGQNTLAEPIKALYQYGELALLSIPLITNNQNSGRRFIKDQINGFVYENLSNLKDLLDKLFADRSLARKAGKSAQGMALKHLSWNAKRASQLTTIYN